MQLKRVQCLCLYLCRNLNDDAFIQLYWLLASELVKF